MIPALSITTAQERPEKSKASPLNGSPPRGPRDTFAIISQQHTEKRRGPTIILRIWRMAESTKNPGGD